MGKKFDYQLINNNSNQIFKNKVRALTGKDGVDYHEWIWLMDYLKWYTNHFIFEGNEELENIKDAIVEKLFWNGYVGITKIGDKPFVLNLSNLKYNINKEIVSAEYIPSLGTEIEEIVSIPKKLNRTNACFAKSNFYSFPLFMGLKTFIDPILKLWKLMPVELENAITKNIIELKNDDSKIRDTLEQEINRMVERNGSLFQVIQGTAFEVKELKSDTITEDIQGFFKFVINYGYARTGRLYNASEKDERNLSNEVSLNELQFQVIRNDFLMYLEKFANNYDKLYGTKTTIRTLQDIESEKKQPKEEEVDINDEE